GEIFAGEPPSKLLWLSSRRAWRLGVGSCSSMRSNPRCPLCLGGMLLPFGNYLEPCLVRSASARGGGRESRAKCDRDAGEGGAVRLLARVGESAALHDPPRVRRAHDAGAVAVVGEGAGRIGRVGRRDRRRSRERTPRLALAARE